MYFDLTDEQQAIKSTASGFLASRFKSERIREIAASESGFDEAGWKEMAELGWAGLALPEEWGGQGLGAVDLGAGLGEALEAVEEVQRPRGLRAAREVRERAIEYGKRRGAPASALEQFLGAVDTGLTSAFLTARAAARPATRPEKRQPPRNVPSSAL